MTDPTPTPALSPEDRDTIRARAERAHPGPWIVVEDHVRVHGVGTHPGEKEASIFEDRRVGRRDAEFIAAARSDVPRLLDALDTAEARGRMAETNLTVAGRALGKALAKGARTREENRTLRAERDEARAASARVREAAARCVADEAAESDLTIARQRDRLRAREEQVRRLRAEVTRLHEVVSNMRAAPAPVWDEDTVVEAACQAVTEVYERHGDRFQPDEEEMVTAVLAVVRRHLPVRPDREAVARFLNPVAWKAYDAMMATYPDEPTNPVIVEDSLTKADAILTAWPGESRATVQAEALREFADTRGVNVGDDDDEWWRGYRQAQRECLHDASARADRIDSKEK